MLPPNDVCDYEHVEQNQEYDVRYHVCFPIACVEWTLYAHHVAMSIDQCKLMQMNVVSTHTYAHRIGSNRIIYVCSGLT